MGSHLFWANSLSPLVHGEVALKGQIRGSREVSVCWLVRHSRFGRAEQGRSLCLAFWPPRYLTALGVMITTGVNENGGGATAEHVIQDLVAF